MGARFDPRSGESLSDPVVVLPSLTVAAAGHGGREKWAGRGGNCLSEVYIVTDWFEELRERLGD